MKIFRRLRSKIGYYLLRRKLILVDRDVHAVNLYGAKKAAVIFQPDSQEVLELVHRFIKSLREAGVDVTAVGFNAEKKTPNIFLLRKDMIFFCLEHLNWYCKPVAPFVESFLREKFDILIDLSMERNYPVDYLVYLSNASFKAGKYFEKGHPFDLTINVSKNDQLPYLIEQLQHYLNLINKPVKHETAEI